MCHLQRLAFMTLQDYLAVSGKKAARELGCDESEEKFKDALRVLGKRKPQPRSK